MSDYNSSLPVRTENDGDVVIKVADATVPSQQLKVEADGSINVNASAINLDIRDLAFATDKVDVSGSTVEIGATSLAALESITVQNGAGASAVNIQDGGNSITVDAVNLDIRDLAFATDTVDVSGSSVTVSATNLDIRDLAFATDKVDASGSTVELGATSLAALESITVQNGAGGAAVNIQDGGNSITVDGTVALSEDHNYGTVGATTLRTASQVGNATGAADFNNGATGAQTLRVAANLAVAGANVSNSNPVPVYVTATAVGTDVLNYQTSASLAAAASVTFTYTVTALKTLSLYQMSASGSGKIKVEFKIAGANKNVQFNSTANPNVNYVFGKPQDSAAGTTVSMTITNRDNQAQDVYGTIEGSES